MSDYKEYITYTLDDKILIMFDPSIKHKTYSCEQYHGIIFYIYNDTIHPNNFDQYDIVHRADLGNRIIISHSEGWEDIPFKKDTFGFLPPGVEAIEI